MLKREKLYQVLIISLLTITFCLISISNAEELEPVNFGFLTWTEGPALESGREYTRGFRAGIKYVNDHGGILGGRMLKGYEVSQGQTGESAKAAALMLIEKYKVKALIGPHWEGMVMAGLETAEKYNLPFCPDEGGSWSLEQGYPGLLEFCPGKMASRTAAVMRWAETKGFKRVAMVVADIPNAHTSDKAIRAVWDKPDSPIKIVGTIWYPFESVSIRRELTKAVSLKPDLIWFEEFSRPTAVAGMRILHDLGYKGTWIITEFINDEAIAELPKEMTEGGRAYFDWFPDMTCPRTVELVNYFKSIYGTMPWEGEEIIFSHVVFLAKAMDKAGTEGDYTMKNLLKIRRAAHEVDWIDFHGEPLDLSPEGLGLWKTFYIAVVRNGKWVLEADSCIPLTKRDYYWLENMPD